MTCHHYKIVVVPATILDVRCVDAEYSGPNAEYMTEQSVELDATSLATHKVRAREFRFNVEDADFQHDVGEICLSAELDHNMLFCLLQKIETDDAGPGSAITSA